MSFVSVVVDTLSEVSWLESVDSVGIVGSINVGVGAAERVLAGVSVQCAVRVKRRHERQWYWISCWLTCSSHAGKSRH